MITINSRRGYAGRLDSTRSAIADQAPGDLRMFELSVRSVMRKAKPLQVAPDALVSAAARVMARRSAGAILVMQAESLVGIFTERDLLVRVVAAGLDAATTRVDAVMTSMPHTIDADKPFGYALLLMHDRGFRHLPVVEAGKLVGIVSSRSALDPELEDFVSEAERRKHLMERGAEPLPGRTSRPRRP